MTGYRGFILCLLVGLLGLYACSQQPLSGQETVQETVANENITPQESGQEAVQDSGPETAPEKNTSEPGQEPTNTEPKPDASETESGEEAVQDSPPVEAPTEKEAPISRPLDTTGGRVCYNNICVEATKENMNGKGVTVLFQKPQGTVPKGSVAPPMDVGPDNWKPLGSVFVVFQNVQVPSGVRPDQLRVAFVYKGAWQFVPTTYDAQKKEWRGETNHFSVWGLVVSGGPCALCHDAETCNGGVCQAPQCQNDNDCGSTAYCSTNLKVCFKKPPCETKLELCNGIDDNCSGQADEGCRSCRTSANCEPGQQCARGTCVEGCAPDQKRCNNQCVDIYLDSNNCGACGVVCDTGRQCVEGACVQ